MITIEKTVSVQATGDINERLPMQVVFESCSCSDVEYDNVITQAGNYNFTITFSDADCLDTCTTTMYLTDALGCVTEIGITYTDACVLDISNIVEDAALTFVPVINSVDIVSYVWTYDTNMFENVSTSPNVLSLQKKASYDENIYSYQICLVATDSFGCSDSICRTFEVCEIRSQTVNDVFSLHCSEEKSHKLVYTACGNNSLSGATMVLTLRYFDQTVINSSKYTYTATVNGDDMDIVFSITDPTLPSDSLYATYIIDDAYGNPIEQNITYVYTDCSDTIEDCPITTECCDVRLECGQTVVRIPVTQCVFGSNGGILDRDQFAFLDPLGGTTPLGNTITYDVGTDELVYTVVVTSTGIDKIEFQVCQEDCCSGAVVLSINLDCYSLPVLVADADCNSCNEAVTIDVLANDTSGIGFDLSTLNITAYPTNGSAGIVSGQIVYIGNNSFYGNDTLTYEICDLNGVCDTEVVTIDVTCPGQDSLNDLACANGDLDLTLNIGPFETGGIWNVVDVPVGSLDYIAGDVIPDPTIVPITDVVTSAGVYNFVYGVDDACAVKHYSFVRVRVYFVEITQLANVLTASVALPCKGTVSYSWSTGASTAAIDITGDPIPTTYTCVITCSEGISCTASFTT